MSEFDRFCPCGHKSDVRFPETRDHDHVGRQRANAERAAVWLGWAHLEAQIANQDS